MNDNAWKERKDDKTSENICDVSSSSKRKSSLYSPSYQSDKQQRSISDPRASLQGFSSRINPSKNSNRRSTVVCVPLSSTNEQDNEIILRVPYRKIQDNYLNNRTRSHDSIAIIKENSSYPIDEPKEESFYSNSDSDQLNFIDKGTTRIKLSLPIQSTGKGSTRHRYINRPTINVSDGNNNVSEEFTLPTNPPITVTIEPQTNLNISKDNSLHDDQICSPDNIYVKDKRTSIDPSLKGASSTIVSYFMDLLKPSDNKLAMKLYGSRKGVLKERLRQQRAGHCIIHPCSNFR